jgi:hypothetical protein
MFVFSSRQMAALALAREAECLARLVQHLDRWFPQLADRADTRTLAHAALSHARGLGLHRETDIFRYANFAVALGVGFEAHPQAAAYHLQLVEGQHADAAWLDSVAARLARESPRQDA